METYTEEWIGARSKRFFGGIQMSQAPNKSESNLLSMNQKIISKGLENVKSKRHFEAKTSGFYPEWKPCLKMISSNSQSKQPLKITELPCTTHLKPLRHLEKVVSNSKQSLFKTRTCWSKTSKSLKFLEEQAYVKNLETWEMNTLNKKPSNNLSNTLRARLDIYKSVSTLSKL